MTTDEARMERELRDVMAKAREAALKSSATTNGRPARRRRRMRFVAVLGAGALTIAIGAAAWAILVPSSPGARRTVYSTLTQAGQSVVHAVGSGVARFLSGGSGARTAAPDQAAASLARAKPPARGAVRKKETAAIPALAQANPILPTALPAPPRAVLVLPADVLEAMARPDEDPGPLYMAPDAHVTPPVPLWPPVGRVMSATAAPTADDMDVIVSRDGSVERVTLLAPNRFQGRMLLAAIKNQQFRPALSHGRAVRYLVRIRVAS